MITEAQLRDVIGSTAYGSDDDKLGKVGQVYLDDQTGQPAFATVSTGLFGTRESYIPIGEATFNGDRLTVPFTTEKVKGAPNVDADQGHLDEAEQDELYRYYGMGTGVSSGYDDTTTTTAGTTGTAGYESGTVGHDTSGPTTDDAMTISEEHLEVGTTTQEAGRARLRKYVTTETESVTVPVSHERAVIESVPITDGNIDAALDGPAISEEEHEVVLHEERPVVGKTTEAVERVRLTTETEVGQETVSDEVRKENIEVEGDVERR